MTNPRFLVALRTWVLRHRDEVIVALAVFPPAFLAVAILTLHWGWWVVFGVSQALLVVAGRIPHYGGFVQILESLQTTVFKILDLRNGDRITIHLLHSKWREKYIQLTNYPDTHRGSGRIYSFRHGIVGRTFTSNLCLVYPVPEGIDFVEAMKTDWQFTHEEALRLTVRGSYMSYPLGREYPYPRAVLYMDSADPQRFTEETKPQYKEKLHDLFSGQFESILSMI
jgi:hypothetical protein